MNRFLIFLALTFPLSSFSQDLMWARSSSSTSNDNAEHIGIDAAGNSYIIGDFEGSITLGDSTFISYGERDLYIAKYDMMGNFVWAKHWGGPANDNMEKLSVDDNGNQYILSLAEDIVMIGDSTFNESEKGRFYYAKCDPNGNFLYGQQIGGSGKASLGDIDFDDQGNTYITGSARGPDEIGDSLVTDPGLTFTFVTKYNSTGSFEWAQIAKLVPALSITSRGESIAVGPGPIVIATGSFRGTLNIGGVTLMSQGNRDVYIIKFDTNGNVLQVAQLGGSGSDDDIEPNDIAMEADGDFYVTGEFIGTISEGGFSISSPTENDVFVAKYDMNLNLLWLKSGGGPEDDEAVSIATNSNGTVCVTGSFYETVSFDGLTISSQGGQDAYMAKYNEDGDIIGLIGLGGPEDDEGTGIAVDIDNNTYLTGQYDTVFQVQDTILDDGEIVNTFVAKFGRSLLDGPVVPTLSEWALIILTVLILIVGITAIKKKVSLTTLVKSDE